MSTIFFSPFLVSLPVGPDNRFPFFVSKRFAFFVNLGQEVRVSLPARRAALRARQQVRICNKALIYTLLFRAFFFLFLKKHKLCVWPYGKGYQEGIPIAFFKKKKRAGKVFLTKMVFEGRGRTQQKKVYKKRFSFFVNLGQEVKACP